MSPVHINPFQPNEPVRPSLFAGRAAERSELRSALVRTLQGHPTHVFFTGERGMGKTSLARFAAEFAVSPEVTEAAGGVPTPLVVRLSLGYCPGVEQLCAAILGETYKQVRERKSSLLDWIRGEIAKLDGVKIGFYGVSLEARSSHPGQLALFFPDAIEGIVRKIEKEIAGSLVIILDETEAISADETFPHFIKSVLETLGQRNVAAQIILTATPEGSDRMAKAHPSFPRLFRQLQIERLSDEEVEQLVTVALKEGQPQKRSTPEFLEVLREYASGLPNFVQEIGYAAFEVDRDGTLGADDAMDGIVGTNEVIGALDQLEQRYFRERYTKMVLSNTYREILHAIARFEDESEDGEVSTRQIRKALPNVAQPGPYLSNMVKRGVIDRVEGKQGVYRLPDRMFGLFLRMAGERFDRRKQKERK